MKIKSIKVFEHQVVRIGDKFGNVEFTPNHLEALQRLYGTVGVNYFQLVNNGVKFNQFVGVLQVRELLIEVLPKIDKHFDDNSQERWKHILIDMMQVVNNFKVQAPSKSSLQLKPNSILDLYFQLFIQEVEYLIRTGLFKKYRKSEGNNAALKGCLKFPKHIQKNIVHKERFYVSYTMYDHKHTIHSIIYMAILLLKGMNTNIGLDSRISSLLFDFPEMPIIALSDNLFSGIVYDRNTEVYREAVEIAGLLLMNYHPDLSKGRENVLALMFDMNRLWEEFLLVTLKKKLKLEGWEVKGQKSRKFWSSDNSDSSYLRPDIIIKKDERVVVLDTKWKLLEKSKLSINDLRQMYAYSEYFGAQKAALVYPGKEAALIKGKFELKESECDLLRIGFPADNESYNVRNLQDVIGTQIVGWLG